MTHHIYVLVGRRRSGGDWYESMTKVQGKDELKALAKRLNDQNGPFEYKVKAKGVK